MEGLLQAAKSAASLDHVLEDGILAIVENTRDADSRRAIHFAAAGGSVKVLKYLIEELKLNVDVKDGSGETPLSRAAIEGRLDTMEYLLQMGANPKIPDDSNICPLNHVAMKGHKEIISLLLSKGINVDVTNDFGSPLHYASTAGENDTVKVLLDPGANPNMIFHGTLTPLQASIHSRSWKCVERFLKAGADPNFGPDGVKALLLAAEEATQIIKILVAAGADPNVTNIHRLKPIEVAVVNGNREGVEILFPVTSPIPSYVDWNVNGIMKHANSKKFKNQEMALQAQVMVVDLALALQAHVFLKWKIVCFMLYRIMRFSVSLNHIMDVRYLSLKKSAQTGRAPKVRK